MILGLRLYMKEMKKLWKKKRYHVGTGKIIINDGWDAYQWMNNIHSEYNRLYIFKKFMILAMEKSLLHILKVCGLI